MLVHKFHTKLQKNKIEYKRVHGGIMYLRRKIKKSDRSALMITLSQWSDEGILQSQLTKVSNSKWPSWHIKMETLLQTTVDMMMMKNDWAVIEMHLYGVEKCKTFDPTLKKWESSNESQWWTSTPLIIRSKTFPCKNLQLDRNSH